MYAYIADNTEGLQVIDISDPESAYILYGVATEDQANDVAVSGEYAYACYIEGGAGGLEILDLIP